MRSTESDLSYWLAALYLPEIGPARIFRWLEYFGSIKNLFVAQTEQLQAAGLTMDEIISVQNPDWKSVERDLRWSEGVGCHLICVEDDRYPALLQEVSGRPLVLYVRGVPELLSRPQIAMVGTRNPTSTGRELAYQFAHHLAKAGFVITSGLALGVDGAAHEGALAAMLPTIAVTGTGLDMTYPASHRRLAGRIAECGALVSEFPPGTKANAHHFPRRNRIISGLSLGVLVIEAAIRSGSLITARLAADQGREVFAVPGSIHNPLARGCHKLIQQGAKLIEKAEDVLEELHALKGALCGDVHEKKAVLPLGLAQNLCDLLALIGYEATSLDTIIVRSGLTAGEVCSMLLSLELRSYVQNVPGGYIRDPSLK